MQHSPDVNNIAMVSEGDKGGNSLKRPCPKTDGELMFYRSIRSSSVLYGDVGVYLCTSEYVSPVHCLRLQSRMKEENNKVKYKTRPNIICIYSTRSVTLEMRRR